MQAPSEPPSHDPFDRFNRALRAAVEREEIVEEAIVRSVGEISRRFEAYRAAAANSDAPVQYTRGARHAVRTLFIEVWAEIEATGLHGGALRRDLEARLEARVVALEARVAALEQDGVGMC